ncbi:MAG: FxsA family protein [Rhodothermales bacterium]
MFFRLLFLFVALPILELALLVKLGEVIGFWPTMGIVVITGLLGSTLTRRQGLTVWRQFNLRLQQGQLPGTELVDGLIILVSGAFLLTPGVLTDFAGFLGLIPFTRALIRSSVLRFVERQQKTGAFQVRMEFGGRRYDPPEPQSPPLEWRGTPVERPGDQA